MFRARVTPVRDAVLVLLAAVACLTVAQPCSSAEVDSTYVAGVRAWQERREKNLLSDTGWLTVTGLFWLHEGDNVFGTASGCDLVLPSGSTPARAGTFVHRDGKTTVHAAPGVVLRIDGKEVREADLRPDSQGKPDIVELGRLRLFVIERSGRFAVRMRDLESELRKSFHGIDRYAIDTAWRVEARFEPYDPPRHIPIASVIGTVDSLVCPGALVFTRDGREQRLEPILEAPDETSLFVIFSDETSGDETYPAGRFLYCDLPRDGKTTLDFNKAYNPPCAFTPFATCPLPPPQNALPIAVRAGEKTYGEH
jgi:uncharacterized protein (DUF1684 family)